MDSIAVVPQPIIGSKRLSHFFEYLVIRFLTTSGDQFPLYLLLCVNQFPLLGKDQTVEHSCSKSIGGSFCFFVIIFK